MAEDHPTTACAGEPTSHLTLVATARSLPHDAAVMSAPKRTTRARWQAIVETWGAIDDAYRVNDDPDPEDRPTGIGWQTHGLRAFAERLRVPYLVALLLSNEITVEELQEWDAWPDDQRAALFSAVAGVR